jgi:anaerobic magnesium-protoporphyrin IX monomethyl ester cyclase
MTRDDKKMKVLLVSPPLSFELGRRIFPRFPPYLLLSVAAQLEKAGFEVKAYDAYLVGARLPDIMREVRGFAPALVGLCPADLTRFSPLEIDIRIVEAVKAAYPGLPVAVFGLSREGLTRELAQRLPALDYMVLGDPEEAMVELAGRIANRRDAAGIAGVLTRPVGAAQAVEPLIIENLDRLQPPAWHLIGLERYRYFPHRYKASRAYPIVGSRGCPWGRCAFCKGVSALSSCVYRSRSAAHLVAEIEDVVRVKGYTEVQFYDGNFNTDMLWLTAFHSLIREKKLTFAWSCLCRVDHISPDALRLMKEAGCWNITFGIETGSQALLDTIDKGIEPGLIRKAVSWARDAGIETTGSFLLGLPGEEPRDVLESARFAVRLRLDYAQFFIAKWHEDHPRFASRGTLLRAWDYSQFDFRGRVFIPAGYKGLAHLKAVQRKAYRMFYFHPITVIPHLRKAASRGGFKRLCAGFMALVKMSGESACQPTESGI